MTTPTCATCGQPIHGHPYLVNWTLHPHAPPTNIYTHPGPCATAANRHYCTPPTPSPCHPVTLSPSPPPTQLPLL